MSRIHMNRRAHPVATPFGPPSTLGERRGILPLLVAALASGAARGLFGAIEGNQQKQRNKGYIDAAYRTASQRLDTEQAATRQDSAESLASRGLAQGGDVNASPIHTAMIDGLMKASGTAPRTIGGQVQSDTGVQMGLERQDLEQQHMRAMQENRADYADALAGSVTSGIQFGENVYGAGSELGFGGGGASASGSPSGVSGGNAAPPGEELASSRSRVHAAMLSATSYANVHPNAPLSDPTSAWFTGSTGPKPSMRLANPAESNASFNGLDG